MICVSIHEPDFEKCMDLAGKYDFTVRVEDESDPGQSKTQKLSIQIKD